jgi:primosomal protein N' (replication factor Y)
MTYAEIVINLPIQPGKAAVPGEPSRLVATFHYSIPPGLAVQPGHLVWVPFGARLVQGVVIALSDTSPVAETKDILSLIDPQPVLTPYHIPLARWLSQRYLCSLGEAVGLLLPPAASQRVITWVAPCPPVTPGTPVPPGTPAPLTPKQQTVLDLLRTLGKVPLDDLKRAAKSASIGSVVEQLVRKGLVSKVVEMPPPRVRPKTVRRTWLSVDTARVEAEIASLRAPWRKRERLLETMQAAGGTMEMAALCTQAGCTTATVRALAEHGLVRLDGRPAIVTLAADAATVTQAGEEYRQLPRGGQAKVLEALAGYTAPVDLSEVYKATGTSFQTIQRLAEKGLVRIEEREVRRDPLAGRVFPITQPPTFTSAQARAWQAILQAIDEQRSKGKGAEEQGSKGAFSPAPLHPCPPAHLLHGVTGSGKTEIYLRTLAEMLQQGKQAIVLVPEIALTPQTIHRFASRFPGNVAVLHSKLSLGEQFDEWRRIREGQADVVIGSRSAIFAPLPRLGLIVLDEEHEWTYKQTDQAPRYHARDVALKLAELTGALVILGSATPDLGSYYRAERGDFRLLELPERIQVGRGEGETRRGGEGEKEHYPTPPFTPSPPLPGTLAQLPPVEIVDLRAELRAGNRSIFSRALHAAMTVALAAHEQVILFLNRRGTATFIMCRDCGFVLKCQRCDAPLAYHEAEDDLVCHHCNWRTLVPDICPACWSRRIKFFGIGTQKVEEEVRKAFPGVRTQRWDRDVTGGKLAHEQILERFIRHQADVLIGTQMIAKGLDLPLVTLVGVVTADTALHMPDFRMGERTFQLLTQVAGRAGRSLLGGKVIIQTYTPEHYAIQAASHHDYATFYRQEIAFRREQGYPPFARLARLIYLHPNKEKAQKEAERFAQVLRQRVALLGLPEVRLIGPAPGYVSRLRGRYRWQIIVKAPDVHPLLEGLPLPPGWSLDVDPVSLL